MIVFVYDRWGNQIDYLKDFSEFAHDDEIGKIDTIEFTIPGVRLEKGNCLVWRDEFGAWHEHKVTSCTTEHVNGTVYQVVYAENSIVELMLKYIDDQRSYKASNAAALTKCLNGTRWTTGTVDAMGNGDVNFYHTSVYDGIVDINDTWGGDISTTITVGSNGVTARRVNHERQRGTDSGLIFTYGFDADSIERMEEMDNVYTRIHVFGKGEETETGGYGRRITFAEINDGKDYVEDNVAREKWGIPGTSGGKEHSEGTFVFDQVTDKSLLLELAYEKLEEVKKPRVTYKANVIVLANAGMDFKNAKTGDTVNIRDKVIDERLSGRFIRVRRYIVGTRPTEVTLGNIVRTISDVIREQNDVLKSLNNRSASWDGAAGANGQWLQDMIDNLNEAMNAVGGYVYWEPGEGITVYDKPQDQNPTMAIQLKGGGFRIANSKKSNGEWDWRTFGTGDGFTADLINVGVLQCGENKIDLNNGTVTFKNGIIQDLQSLNYLNLGTGEFRLAAATTIGDKTVPEYITEGINNFVNAVYDPKIAEIQAQLDGQLETWFFPYEPTLNNEPAVNWKTEAERAAHEGDLFFDKNTGYSYRFFKDGNTWKWQLVQDSDITKALEAAALAQDTADSKRRVFVATPKPPYDIGDLWVQGENGDLMRCATARKSGNYVSTDWIKATKYTDNSALEAFIGGDYKNTLKEINDQIDGKADTWYQTADPSKSWTTAALKKSHIGDLWLNPDTNVALMWDGSKWTEFEAEVPQEVFDKIDGKAQIFVNQPTPPYQVGDLWVQGSTGDIKRCMTGRKTGNYSASDWVLASKYTDDSALNNFLSNEYASTIKDIETQIDGKIETWYQASNPATSWNTDQKKEHIGDIWFNTSTTENSIKRWNGTAWVEMEVDPPSSVFDAIDGKAQIFVGEDTTAGRPKPPYYKNDLWFLGTNGGIKTCITTRKTGSYVSSDWAVKNNYIDKAAADASASAAVNGQTSEFVFNKLTNNGAIQGIYMEQGNLYINGTYIATGKIASPGGSYWDLDNGNFETIYTVSSSVNTTSTTYTRYLDSIVVVRMSSLYPFGIYKGARYRDVYKNGNPTKYYAYGSLTFIGGIEVDGSNVYFRADRVGVSKTNYITTGVSSRNRFGATFHNNDGDYLNIESTKSPNKSANTTDGCGFMTFNKSFLVAGGYDQRLWLWPPSTATNNTFEKLPNTYLYMGEGTTDHIRMQTNEYRYLFMPRAANGQTILAHVKNDKQNRSLYWDNDQCYLDHTSDRYLWWNTSYTELTHSNSSDTKLYMQSQYAQLYATSVAYLVVRPSFARMQNSDTSYVQVQNGSATLQAAKDRGVYVSSGSIMLKLSQTNYAYIGGSSMYIRNGTTGVGILNGTWYDKITF